MKTSKRVFPKMRRNLWVVVAALALMVAGAGCGKKKKARVRSPRLPAVAVHPGDVEHGYASWYGHPYHGRATSSGEIYDMHRLTAAHRTMPFGTDVEVTNMENGQKVRVRINDRGPFVDGRIIDLSLTAAKAIGMVGPGTALVDVKVVRVPEYAAGGSSATIRPAATGSPAIAGRFTVQVGAFAIRQNAERLRDDLAHRYPQFPVNTAPTPDGSRYRVWVGNEPSEERAASVAQRLRQDSVTAFVVRLD